MIDASVRMGLDFEEGWIYPLTIQFVDSAPSGIENALAYVQLRENSQGIYQSLNINLALFQKDDVNFRGVLGHELVHAMLNDAVGAQASSLLPLWFHEGLAVYGGNQGEEMFLRFLSSVDEKEATRILDGLDEFHSATDYLESYLAFHYIYERKGISSLRNFVKEVVKRKGDISGALSYTCFESWDDFQKNTKEYSLEKFRGFYREKDRSLRR
ncbi:MAG: hypothetical protein ACKVQC_01260 [Elusimicrobiota bacterium]